MDLKGILLFSIVIILCSCSSQLSLTTPSIEPRSPDQAQSDLIEEGISLHDQGNYEEALAKYAKVLELNPQNVWALYEMAYTYYAMEKFDQSLELCLEAAKYKSPYLPAVYNHLGNLYDQLGEPDKALVVYEKGTELYPDNHLLHYNMGITELNLRNIDEAKTCFKKSLVLASDHAGSNLALGEIYFDENYRIPALLAFFRFLILEPTSQRTPGPVEKIQDLLGRGVVAQDDQHKEINILIPKSQLSYDGDFSTVDLGLNMSRAIRFTDESKGKSELQSLTAEIGSLFQLMLELEEKGSHQGFVWEYYAPYFCELKRRDFLEPFINHIFQASNLTEIRSWFENNQEQYEQFLNWSGNYQFSKTQ
jgi:tetratricopeptide (TPR) repeat protein